VHFGPHRHLFPEHLDGGGAAHHGRSPRPVRLKAGKNCGQRDHILTPCEELHLRQIKAALLRTLLSSL
jgi:hypothetical protein